MRLVGWARERAHEVTHTLVAAQLTDAIRAILDGLLVSESSQSRHAWLRARPSAVSATDASRAREAGVSDRDRRR
jgi:hypothetical protein